MKPEIVIDDKIPFVRGVFEPFARVIYLPGKAIDNAALRTADALLTRTRTICDRRLLEGSRIRSIASATIGIDHIDTGYCRSAGIRWANAPGCNSSSVKQYIASVIARLAVEKGLNLEEMTLGIVGVGHVGSKVAEVGRAFGMKVLLNDPPREQKEGGGEFTSLESIVGEADIISLHVPLVADGPFRTVHLFDRERISLMRRNQILINSSRGPVVDGGALKEALREGRLNAAVLDVWENEPDIDPALAGLCFVATPHIAGYSADGKAAGTTAAVRWIARELGLPLSQWSVKDIPSPERETAFSLDGTGISTQEALVGAVLKAYDVKADSERLKGDISSFERQRGGYPVRREPCAFTVCLTGAGNDLTRRLRLLDFNVKIDGE